MADKRIAVIFDDDYQSEGNYAYDIEAETRAAVEEEQGKLNSGEWTAYGIIIYRPCDVNGHNYGCAHAEHIDSLWGVVEDSGHDGVYDSPEQIRNEYIRGHATEMWKEASDG